MAIALLPLDVQTAQQTADGDLTILAGAANADMIASMVQEAATMQAQMYARTYASAPWTGYLVQNDAKNIVGICSFKDAPREGIVEIAYVTFPEYEGQGWGGDMATALVDIALGEESVNTIIAHTLPGDNPSTKILNRLGFEHAGTFEDPDDGTVWQWVLERE